PDRIVGRDGRAKAYRPLPVEARRAAIEAGLAAYDRGDFFEAHEELEPAGIRTNLTGARRLLAEAAEGPTDNAAGVDVDALLADVDARLADLDAHPDAPTLSAPVLRHVAAR